MKDRILRTLKFFDLQDYPLTLLELHRYLLAPLQNIKQILNSKRDVPIGQLPVLEKASGIEEVLREAEQMLGGQIEQHLGFYCLPGREKIIENRLAGYAGSVHRERLIRRFGRRLAYVPFVRGVALAGSQAMGRQKPTSDIDLFIVAEPGFMWIARTFATIYFHFMGVRRHHNHVANRFCLNHYVSGIIEVDRERNLYKAMEYFKLRPLVYPDTVAAFQEKNLGWMSLFFPNARPLRSPFGECYAAQALLEKIFTNRFGIWLERTLASLQTKRIRQSEFNFVTQRELSFHPESRHGTLLDKFFNSGY